MRRGFATTPRQSGAATAPDESHRRISLDSEMESASLRSFLLSCFPDSISFPKSSTMPPAPTRPTLLCCAFPFGYGPAVKLLLIARRLRAAGVHTTFLGHGISHEMATNCTDAFDEVIHAHPTDPSVANHIAHAAGLFSMMDRDFSALAQVMGKPVYVADSLTWMRDQLPAPFISAKRYWVQNFLPAGSASRTTNADATIPVGPIVEPRSPTPPHQRRGLVINLGGCETPAGPEAENFAYADFIMRGILRSGAVETFESPITLLAGHHAIAHLKAAFPDSGINLRTATHDEALDLLGRATHVLTSPGLTTTLECFQFAVPTYFLPPQNYSQWRIQHHLRSIGLATHTFDWSVATTATPLLLDTVPESARTPLIRQAISEASTLPSAIEQFANSLHQWLATDQGPLATRQREFFDSLGPNGVDTIAEELIRIFK
jgi:hypothetical protein